jgi:hypothetical protein
VHSTGQLLGASDPKEDSPIRSSTLSELIRHVSNVLFDEVPKVLKLAESGLHNTGRFVIVESHNVQHKRNS